MTSRSGTADRNVAILIVVSMTLACVLLAALLLHLVRQQRASVRQQNFDRAISALVAGDGEAARRELRTMRESIACQRQVDLIEIGETLIGKQPEVVLQRLEDVLDHAEIHLARSILIAQVLIALKRLDDAEARYQSILQTDPNNTLALDGLQRLSASRAMPENDRQFVAKLKPVVAAFCGDCHATPLPESFPKSQWAKEVDLGYDFYKLFERHDLMVPNKKLVLKYFQLLAPDSLDLSVATRKLDQSEEPQFVRSNPQTTGDKNVGAAHVSWVTLGKDRTPVILACNMRDGRILTMDPNHPDRPANVLALLDNPCHATTCDLNQDGRLDLLVADLGSFYPEDHSKGRVVCLQATDDGHYEPIVLLRKVGRVADVQPGDFDGDGDIDLIVAEFGWRKTGRVLYLENTGASSGKMDFAMRQIDRRHGTIHVPVVDINQDGHLDFVALISQEHEAVVAFLNDGHGQFTPHTLYSANDPSFGSSGMQLVDLDQDNDIDILYTNGDNFDSELPKPYHGIQWLENKGGLEFEYHHLLNCCGVFGAIAGDVDADGDLDILAVTALATNALDPDFVKAADSIICLVNDGQQNYKKQVIERGVCFHVTCDAGDFDGDGDLDLAVGRLNLYQATSEMPLIDIWRNQKIVTSQ